MKWVIQENIFKEYNYNQLIETMIKLSLDYIEVRVIPFTNILLDVNTNIKEISEEDNLHIDIPDDGKIICMGATTLTRIARSRNWSPGTYLSENFDYLQLIKHWGNENILNSDIFVDSVKNLPYFDNDIFIRPIEDTKAIAGTLMSPSGFKDWKDKISRIESREFVALSKETIMMVSSVKKIASEYRIFVVDNKIVSGSQYKQGSQVITNEYYPQYIDDYVESLIKLWVPNKAFVIDIALLPDYQIKVIEVNCINSAGFYKINLPKVINAIEVMES